MHKLFLLAPVAQFLMVVIIQLLQCSALPRPHLIPHNCRNHDNSTVAIREAVSTPGSSCSIMNSITQPDSPPQGKFPNNYEQFWGKAHASSKCDGPESERRVFPSLYPGDCLFWGVNNLCCCMQPKLENEWILVLWIKTKTPPCSCRISYNSRSVGYLEEVSEKSCYPTVSWYLSS